MAKIPDHLEIIPADETLRRDDVRDQLEKSIPNYDIVDEIMSRPRLPRRILELADAGLSHEGIALRLRLGGWFHNWRWPNGEQRLLAADDITEVLNRLPAWRAERGREQEEADQASAENHRRAWQFEFDEIYWPLPRIENWIAFRDLMRFGDSRRAAILYDLPLRDRAAPTKLLRALQLGTVVASLPDGSKVPRAAWAFSKARKWPENVVVPRDHIIAEWPEEEGDRSGIEVPNEDADTLTTPHETDAGPADCESTGAWQSRFSEWAAKYRNKYGRWPPRDPDKHGNRGYRQWATKNQVRRQEVDSFVKAQEMNNSLGAPRRKCGK